MEKRYLVLCDIDDTLFRSNTTFDFITYATNKHALQRWWLRLLTRRWSPVFLLLTVLGIPTGHDLVKQQGVRLLKGLSRNQVDHMAFAFYDEWLASKLNREIWKLLNSFEGSTIVLVSSTLDPVARAIASRLGVGFRSSELEFVNDKLTGRMSGDIAGQKHRIAGELRQQQPSAKLVVITDNRTDRALVELADERFVVIRDESDKLFWSDLRPAYLRR